MTKKTPSIKEQLAPIRREIDEIDLGLLELLHRRLELVRSVGEIKRATDRGAWVPSREKRILDRLLRENRGKYPERALAEIFRAIFSVSRREERPETIAYYGAPGSMAHQAAEEQFGTSADYESVGSLEEVFDRVAAGRVHFGVVPPEISREGLVTHSFELFLRSDLKICAEYFTRLHLTLSAAAKRRSYRRVYLQPQVLGHVREWLPGHVRGYEIKITSTSREAAELAASDPQGACICPPFAARHHHLKIIEPDIPYGAPIHLRFLVAGRTVSEATREDKTTIAFSLTDRMGALEKALIPFRKRRINITFLESYPVSRVSPTVTFFADVIGHQEEERLVKAVGELRRSCAFVKVLGSYPVFKI